MAEAYRDLYEEFWNLDTLRELSSSDESLEFFSSKLSEYLEYPKKIVLVESARFAIQRIFELTKRARRKVLMSAVNCPVVAIAVRNAGFEIETFDFENPFGKLDFRSRILSRPLDDVHAVIITHFFGSPYDFLDIIPFLRAAGVLLIEDCAQTLGGRVQGKLVGTMGDVGILSFNEGKPILLGGGGALIINRAELVETLSHISPSPPSSVDDLERLVTLKKSFDLRRRLPPSKSSASYRTIKNFLSKAHALTRKKKPLQRMLPLGNLRASLGAWQLERYPAVLRQRNLNAALLRAECKKVQFWNRDPATEPASLKERIILSDLKQSRELLRLFQQRGIKAGNLNWSETINRPNDRKKNPHSEKSASLGFDLPIHQNMSDEDLQFICETLNKVIR